MQGRARSEPGALARGWAWLRGLADDLAIEEWEEKSAPASQGDDGKRVPPASLDEVLRVVVTPRRSGGGTRDGKGEPTVS